MLYTRFQPVFLPQVNYLPAVYKACASGRTTSTVSLPAVFTVPKEVPSMESQKCSPPSTSACSPCPPGSRPLQIIHENISVLIPEQFWDLPSVLRKLLFQACFLGSTLASAICLVPSASPQYPSFPIPPCSGISQKTHPSDRQQGQVLNSTPDHQV